MDDTDQKKLKELQIALAFSIQCHRGNLYCPEVVTISQQLDTLVVKVMRQGRDT